MKVLIVDDEKEFSDFLAFRLEQLGYSVLHAENGKKGLKLIKTDKPDIIIADVNMPEMDGYEFSKLAKNLKAHQHIPIIMLTSMETSDAISKAFSCGACDYISKPFNLSGLVEKLRKAVKHE